eukprot:SAG31_NODE_41534_length_275_cov_1.170455_1_plen_91_part_11
MCGMPYAGLANAPLPLIMQGFETMMGMGFPVEKMVATIPWYGCDFDCGPAGNPYGGVNCTNLRPREYCHGSSGPFCFNNISQQNVAQLLPL